MKIIQEVETVRQTLKAKNDFGVNPIDLTLPVIPPFIGTGKIKLIVLGQDPTIKNVKTRSKITCTLNLDKNNSLKTYINRICSTLGISIDNVYATNVFKYFYTVPPANTMEVLEKHLKPNLNLLRNELEKYGNAPIVTLGEPVLQLLTNEYEKVREFWDYNKRTKSTDGRFACSMAKDNLLKRDFFPLPHQPSIRKEFYNANLESYLQIVTI